MNKFLGWTANINAIESYLSSINLMLSSDENFAQFRNGNGGYNQILEHLNMHEGQVYANYISEYYHHLIKYLDDFKENDKIGNPILYNYETFGSISPTTLRYIKFFGDIERAFGDLNGLNLVEIGGGYGGLVRALTSIYKFNTIKLFDLPEPLQLQKKYLSSYNIDAELYTYEDNFTIEANSLVVSNYAWCECDVNTRSLYLDKIINKCNYVYMVVYGVDVDNELMTLSGEKTLYKETLNDCKVFTLKK